MRIIPTILLLTVAVCFDACGPRVENKEQNAFIARMKQAGNHILARDALKMPGLTEVCIIPESSSVERSLGPFGYRTPGGTQLQYRPEFSKALIDGEAELLAITKSRQVLLYFDNASDASFKLMYLPSGCYKGQTALLKKSADGWWEIVGERQSEKSR